MKALFYTAIAVFIGLAGVVAFYALQTPEDAASTRIVLHIDTSAMPGENTEPAAASNDTGQAEETTALPDGDSDPHNGLADITDLDDPADREPKPVKSYGRLSDPGDAAVDDTAVDIENSRSENQDIRRDRADNRRNTVDELQLDRSALAAVEAEDAPKAEPGDEELIALPGTSLGPIESEGPSEIDNYVSPASPNSIGGIVSAPGTLLSPGADTRIGAEESDDGEAQRLVDELADSIDTQSRPEIAAAPAPSETIVASESPAPAEISPNVPSEGAEPEIAEAQSEPENSSPAEAINDQESTSAEIAALLQESSEAASPSTNDAPSESLSEPAFPSSDDPVEEAVSNRFASPTDEADNTASQLTAEQPSQLAALTPEVTPDVVDEASLVPPPPAPERRPASIPSVEVAAANGWAESIAASARRQPAKVALLLRGVGQNSLESQAAIDSLPPAVSLGFLPEGESLLWAVRARERGHEVIVQLPLEPSDYPANNPSPNTLLSSDSAEQNVSRLTSVLSNFEGYSGVTNYHGGKFLQSREALRPILEDVKSRGLIYVGEGTSSHNVARRLAGEIKLRYGQPSVKIDSNASPLTVKRALARLIAIAHQRGSAIAIGDVSSATIEQVQAWSESLAAHGITLVPVGVLAQADGAS